MNPSPPGPLRRGVSLERRLPLLITALLAVSMAAAVGFAYAEVKRFAEESSLQRVELIAQQLSGLVASGLPRRLALLREVGAEPEIRALFDDPSAAADAEAEALLLRYDAGDDEPLPHVVWTRDGRPLLRTPADFAAAVAADGIGPLPDSTGIGPFFQAGDATYFWVVAPVLRGGRTIGFLGERRTAGGPGTAEQIEALIGGDIAVYFANASGGAWTTLNGRAVPSPPTWPFSGATAYDGDGGQHFANAVAVPGTPFSMVAEIAEATVLQRPALFLRRAGLALLLLLGAGAVGAWLVSRGVTRPVRELRLASEALARGEYDRRIDLHRGDELGILADTFNGMAARVQATHDELTHHYLSAQALAGELEVASRTKSEFLATMSHEIRTPINAIVGYTDLLEMGVSGEVTAEQRRQLHRIRASGRHLLGLVDQVLDFERTESGTLRVDRRTAAVAESIETAMTVLRPQASARQVELSLRCDDASELRYVGDPPRVDQILVNLLSNAIKFSEPGTRTSVACGIREGALPGDGPRGRWVWLAVQDGGVGIAAEQLENVFEPFVQLESGYTRRFGGTGLGLAISRRLARSMGGELTVQSEEGVGSCFTLWLPAADARRA